MPEECWTPQVIAERLAEAADVLGRLPPERVGAWYSFWPRMVSPASEVGGVEQRSRPSAPSPETIDRMDETLGWLAWLEPAERRIVWMRAEGLPWKRITRRLGIGRTTAWQRWTVALHKIAARLNAPGEQDRPNNNNLNRSTGSVLQRR